MSTHIPAGGDVIAELNARKGHWRAICAACDLRYYWLTKFAQGRIHEPGLSKIERLRAYIAANPLPATATSERQQAA